MSILLAEDDENTAAATMGLLIAASYSVSRVRSVAAARASLADRPHVALLDVRLPDGSGIDLVPEIRSALPDCKIVVISGDPIHMHEAAALAAGAHAVMEKPVRFQDLLKILPAPQALDAHDAGGGKPCS